MATNECRREHCTCTTDEQWSCLTDQKNEFDRPDEEKEEKKVTREFKEAVMNRDMAKITELFPKVRFKW